MSELTLHLGDAVSVLKTLPEKSVHCCVTSPPYWGLRDYGHEGQLGLEPTPDEYVANMVAVFREVRRVLRDDGTLWLNLGDSYASQGGAHGGRDDNQTGVGAKRVHSEGAGDQAARTAPTGLKPKDLVGIPWRVAFALQADGWWLRQDIIWHKPNPMPESITDRCTKAHEYIFLLSKSARYYYDADAVKEKAENAGTTIRLGAKSFSKGQAAGARVDAVGNGKKDEYIVVANRNRRSVWTVTTRPYAGAHFATFPPKLIEPCILAGCPEGGTVLDPFGGSGTTAEVAINNGRRAVLIELNEEYHDLIRQRIKNNAAQIRLAL